MSPKHSFPRSFRCGRLTWFCLLGLVIPTLLAACGGSSSTNSSPTPTITITFISDVPTGTPTSAGSTPTSAPATPSQATPVPTATASRLTPTPTRPPQPTPTPTPTPTPSPTPTPPPKVTVTIITNKNGTFAFSPAIIRITRGTVVVWANTTKAPHTATGGSFNSGTIKSGGTYSFKFTSAGTFPYQCNIHPYMTATVLVT